MVELGLNTMVEQLEALGRCSQAIWVDPYYKHRCGGTYYHSDGNGEAGLHGTRRHVGFA